MTLVTTRLFSITLKDGGDASLCHHEAFDAYVEGKNLTNSIVTS